MPRSDMQLPPVAPAGGRACIVVAAAKGDAVEPTRRRPDRGGRVAATYIQYGPDPRPTAAAESAEQTPRGARAAGATRAWAWDRSRVPTDGKRDGDARAPTPLCIMIDGVWTLERPAPSERAGLQGCVSCGRRSDPGPRRRRIRASSSDWFALHDEMGV